MKSNPPTKIKYKKYNWCKIMCWVWPHYGGTSILEVTGSIICHGADLWWINLYGYPTLQGHGNVRNIIGDTKMVRLSRDRKILGGLYV